MKKFSVIALILLIPWAVFGQEILLPKEIDARAYVIKDEVGGLWEKTLAVVLTGSDKEEGQSKDRAGQRRRTISTNDGIIDVAAVVNHSAHPDLWKRVCEEMKTRHEVGGKVYLRKIKNKVSEILRIDPDQIAIVGTAADMDNLAVITKSFDPFVVTALVTAGARSNALRSGLDEGTHIEGHGKEDPKGTVNIIILSNARFTDGGLVRGVITVTEAKTAAFQDLHVPSTYTKEAQATGTGTDSVIIVSGSRGPMVTYPGGHSRIGELMAKATYEAVIEALGKQNGFFRKKYWEREKASCSRGPQG